MAFDLLNRAYTIGTVDGAQDITPGVAQTGFRDYSTMPDSDTTYVLAVQGALWAYMTVLKVGAILRPQAYHDGSSGEGNSVTFSAGVITVFTDLGWQHIVYNDANGVAQNAEGVLKSFSPETLVDLKTTTPIPASGKTVAFLRGILAGDKKGGLYVWEPTEATAGDDFNYVVSSLSATGRWVRQKQMIEIGVVSDDTAAYNGATYKVGDEIREKTSAGIVKKVPRVENFHQGEFSTFAAWKAIPSAQWTDGDTFVFRGITEENDLGGDRIAFVWNGSNTDTATLDVITIRPTDITGSNPGRAVIHEIAAATKFADSDATPSVKGSRFHRIADTPPASITAIDDIVDGQIHYIFPGSSDQVFANGASLICPNNDDYTFRSTDAPVMAVSDNGVVSLIVGGAGNELTLASNQVSATNLADSTHAVNTAAKRLGKSIIETTNNRAYWALGPNATDNWRPYDDQSGISDITPA